MTNMKQLAAPSAPTQYLYSNEYDHMTLCSSIVHYMEPAIITNLAVNQTLRQHIIDVYTNKVWVDEDVIVASAD